MTRSSKSGASARLLAQDGIDRVVSVAVTSLSLATLAAFIALWFALGGGGGCSSGVSWGCGLGPELAPALLLLRIARYRRR